MKGKKIKYTHKMFSMRFFGFLLERDLFKYIMNVNWARFWSCAVCRTIAYFDSAFDGLRCV